MWELLGYLWPDFSALFGSKANNTNALSAFFWVLMAFIFFISTGLVGWRFLQFRNRLGALQSLVNGQSRERLADERRSILNKAEAIKSRDVANLWKAFDESLVSSSDSKQLFNTLDAEHFFNASSLAQGITGSRLLAAVPGFLVAIGVLGTFVGLTVGLVGLQLDGQADVNQLKAGIHNLIAGAAVAFMTSVWGVLSSLLLNFFEKLFERSALSDIREIQEKIDRLCPSIAAEQSLIHIADYSREAKESLQELHERIGDRLQEEVKGISNGMQTAITDALNNVMGPAIQALVNATSQNSTETLEKLVLNFMEGIGSAGRDQGNLMQLAAANVQTAVDGMGVRIHELSQVLGDQQTQQVSAAQQQGQQFETQLVRLGESADQRQQQMEQRFNELMEKLSTQLSIQLGSVQERDTERQATFERVLSESNSSQNALLERFSEMGQAQMQAMLEATQERQHQLEKSFSGLMASLNIQMKEQLDASEQREQARTIRHEQQQAATSAQQQQLFSSLGQSSERQIASIAESALTQQRNLEETVGKLLADLTVRMMDYGVQAEQREAKREDRLNEQLQSLTAQQQELLNQIASATQATQRQSQQMVDQYQQVIEHLKQATESTATSSQHMNSSATQLGLLASHVQQAAMVLGERLEQVSQGIEQASYQNKTVAEQLQQQASTLTALQVSIQAAAEHFEQAAIEAHKTFEGMQQHQKEFLQGVRLEFNELGDVLKTQIQGVEQQAEQWLQAYAKEVSQQVHERMDQWNKETLSFATQMQAAVQAVSNIVDELEVRR